MIIELSDQLKIDLTRPPFDTEGLGIILQGNKGAGKSNTMAVLAEEANAKGIPFIYYDPNGGACSFRELGDDIVILGDPHHPDPIRRAHYPLEVAQRDPGSFIEMVLRDGYSLVVDLTEGDDPDLSQMAFQALINAHFRLAGRNRIPCFVFIDEAHNFAPQTDANKLEKLSLRAIGKVANDGRKRGMLLVVATQRITYLSKRIVFGMNIRIFGKVTYWPDYDSIRHYIPVSFQQMRALHSGEVFVIGEGLFENGKLGKVKIRRRRTTDLDATPLIKPRPRKKPSIHQLELNLPFSRNLSVEGREKGTGGEGQGGEV